MGNARVGVLRSAHQGGGFRRGVRHGNRDGEGGPSTRCRVDCKFALEQFCKFPADGQPQSGSRELPCMAGIRLPELLEDDVNFYIVSELITGGELYEYIIKNDVFWRCSMHPHFKVIDVECTSADI